jgi:hypothetical protein
MVHFFKEQRLDFAARGPFAKDPRWQDLGIIENEKIRGFQKFRDVAEYPVRAGSRYTIHAEKFCGRAVFIGKQSDLFFRKWVIEIG